jgi:hypothetical protein
MGIPTEIERSRRHGKYGRACVASPFGIIARLESYTGAGPVVPGSSLLMSPVTVRAGAGMLRWQAIALLFSLTVAGLPCYVRS